MNLKKPFGRALENFKPLTSAEQRVLDACEKGEGANLDSVVPDAATDENRVRAAFLRFLLLGGDVQAPVHEAGLHLQGAFVEGVFDLSGCHITLGVNLMCCRFADEIDANHAQLDGVLSLQGCYLANGLQARQLRSSASLLLSNGFHAMGQVTLRGSQIAGDLDCRNGQFEVDTSNHALAADGAHVQGIVFLSEGFQATGGVGLVGAKIGGSLYCDGGKFDVKQGQALSASEVNVKGSVLLCDGFSATGEVGLESAQIGGNLYCNGGQFAAKHGQALFAVGANISGSVALGDDFKATGEVVLEDARIGSNLYCDGGLFEVKQGNALSVRGTDINGSVSLRDGFKAVGRVTLQGAQVRGNLLCSGGHFEVVQDEALSASGIDVRGSVILGNDFNALGEVELDGAKIGGNLDCINGQFAVKSGHALSAVGVDIKGGVALAYGFKATGAVSFVGAQIRGDLVCSEGQFEVEQDYALLADRLNITGSIFLRDGFKATGTVRLMGAQIGGELACSGGQFEAKQGCALWIDGAEVASDLKLDKGFRATGEVRLVSAQIGCNLDCSGGQFEVVQGAALTADRANIKGDVLLVDDFKATGQVRFLGAQIGNDLHCFKGRFEVPVGIALSVDSAFVRGGFCLWRLPQSIRISAANANVGVLSYDLSVWAVGSVLDGLRYASLDGQASANAVDRLEWLCRQSDAHLGETEGGADFCPQPWRQLQRVLREMGHTEDAKQVGIAFQDRLRKIGRMGQWPKDPCDVPRCFKGMVTRSAHYAFGKLAGYGYRPVDLLMWMLGVWLVCGSAYWLLALPPQSAIAPSDPLVFQNQNYEKCHPNSDPLDDSGKPGNWYLCADLPSEYATFSPFAFSLDLLLPVVDLGQEKAWGAFVPTPQESVRDEWFSWKGWHLGHAVRFLTWFQTLFGWLCSLLLVAIVSGYSRRNDEGA